MPKYDLRGAQVGAVGDNAKAENVTFNMGIQMNKFDLDEVISELSQIKINIESESDKSSDHYVLLANLTDAVDIARKGEREQLLEKLTKIASNMLYTFSFGVGSGVVANIISKAIGI